MMVSAPYFVMSKAAKQFRATKQRKFDPFMPCRKHYPLYKLAAWQKLRLRHLCKYPLCVDCMKEGRSVLATIVDHIKDHVGNLDLFFDESNLQSLCAKHHSQKTYREHNGKSKT